MIKCVRRASEPNQKSRMELFEKLRSPSNTGPLDFGFLIDFLKYLQQRA